MWVLGIAGTHNAAAALTNNGRVVVGFRLSVSSGANAAGFLHRMEAAAGQLLKYCLDYASVYWIPALRLQARQGVESSFVGSLLFAMKFLDRVTPPSRPERGSAGSGV